MISEETCE